MTIPGAPTQRVRLARVALAAALAHPDVVAVHTATGSVRRAPDAGEQVDGVSVVAASGGRYDVALHLVVRPVALHALATAVAERVHRAAADQGLGPLVGAVDIAFEDLVEGVA